MDVAGGSVATPMSLHMAARPACVSSPKEPSMSPPL